MTNPTSNFGWQMPTPTDLVTDLPADFEVFGQAVDTDFADLLGGTTGQILSKASATDLDFTWITNDVGDITAVTVTAPITGGGTSGSVGIAISAATTSASGAVQLSDSTSTTSSVLASTPTATKSAYDLAASAYAPAFTNNFYAGKNKIINGNFNINQRAFTSVTTNATYTYDRWRLQQGGSDGTTTITPQTFTPGAAPVSGYESVNFLRIATTGQTDVNTLSIVNQPIEDVRIFAGQTVSVSFYAKAASGTPKVAINVEQNFGTGGSASVSNYAGQVTLTTSWARYSVSIAMPSISGKTIGANSRLNLQLWTSAGSTYNSLTGSLGIQTATIDFWGVQLEAGSVATPFQTASGSVQGELALCQRYYYDPLANNATANLSVVTAYSANSTTLAYGNLPLPVTMRTAPTLTVTAASFALGYPGSLALTALTALATNNNILFTFTTSSMTVNQSYSLYRPGTTASIALSAEL
jgi:hypothetical protein